MLANFVIEVLVNTTILYIKLNINSNCIENTIIKKILSHTKLT